MAAALNKGLLEQCNTEIHFAGRLRAPEKLPSGGSEAIGLLSNRRRHNEETSAAITHVIRVHQRLWAKSKEFENRFGLGRAMLEHGPSATRGCRSTMHPLMDEFGNLGQRSETNFPFLWHRASHWGLSPMHRAAS